MENEVNITIFTPTYNRAKTLIRLYNSLLNQTYKKFDWIIVDDGSNDNTEEIVSEFKRNANFYIFYKKVINGGKHRAINEGVKIAKGKLFFIVDSDDYLIDNSLELIIYYWNTINNNKDFAGIAGLKIYENGESVVKSFIDKTLDCSIVERRYVYGLNGDMAEVFLTEVLKEYPFPDFKNEKFCPEGLIWNRISLKYKIRFFNQPIYVCEYLDGGLSSKSVINRKLNSNYSLQLYSELSKNKQLPFKFKIRAIINFWRFSFVNKKSFRSKLKMLDLQFFGILFYSIGYIYHLKDIYYDNFKLN